MTEEWDKVRGFNPHPAEKSFGPDKKLRMESFLQDSADAIWMVDLEERVLRINPAFESLFGWSESEVVGRRLPTTPYFLKREMSLLMQQVKQGLPTAGLETKCICKDGRLLHISATLSPVRNPSGDVIAVSGTCRDISHSKRSEQELRKTKELLEAFILNSQDAIWMIDVEERVLQVNPAFEALFGWSEEEVLGKRLPIIPDFLEADMHQLHQEIKAGRSLRGFETQRQCFDGRLIYVSATLSPVRDNRGEVIGISGTCRDITHLKRSEEELRKTKERLEAIVQNSADAIWLVDLEGRVLQINPAFEAMFGWSEAEIAGKHLPIIPDFLAAEIHELHQQIKTGRSLRGYETQRRCKNGQLIYVSATLSPVRNNRGEVIGISGTCRDISQNKQSEEMLIQTEKLSIAGQLAAGLAHEIRNPLTALKGFVQLMQFGQETHHKYLEVMESELSRIEMIVSELLVLAKPQANSFKRLDLVSILQDVLTLSETQAILHNVQIEAEFPDALPAIDCDLNQMKQVFINFIKNAIEAMPNGGRLRLFAHLPQEEPGQIRIRVADEGTGIPQEHLARLGEPFYTTKTKGTGLGLMVSKKIIDGHRGRLEITSEVGTGTTVDVYLPLPV